MERTTFGLLFYIRRDKTNKKGEAPVFMRLTINGERADASIKRFIEPHAWNIGCRNMGHCDTDHPSWRFARI